MGGWGVPQHLKRTHRRQSSKAAEHHTTDDTATETPEQQSGVYPPPRPFHDQKGTSTTHCSTKRQKGAFTHVVTTTTTTTTSITTTPHTPLPHRAPLRVDVLERVAAVPVHVPVTVGRAPVREQERHLPNKKEKGGTQHRGDEKQRYFFISAPRMTYDRHQSGFEIKKNTHTRA